MQAMVPISLYVTIELVKVGQVIFINLDLGLSRCCVVFVPDAQDLYYEKTDNRMACRSLTIAEDLAR